MNTKHLRLGFLLGTVTALTSLQAGCVKTVNPGTSTLRNAQSTQDTLDELARRVVDNSWEFEIDVEKLNEDVHDPASKLSDSIDFFGRPYKEVQSCPDSEKVRYEDGSTACKTFDNAMTYVYATGQRSDQPYVHIIPERQGLDQPEMEKYIRDGDLMVYFYSRGRSGPLNQSGMKWRASHATTITKKMVDGQLRLARVDNPSNYGHPFNGDDQSTFHIFRFMPKNQDGSDMDPIKADIHRDSVAKWGTLGYDHFGFASYDVAAFKMRTPADITNNYANAYLNTALSSALSERGVTPPNDAKGSAMYCAWFVYMNLNLGWMHPWTPAGIAPLDNSPLILGDTLFPSDGPRQFSDISRDFQWKGDASFSSYLGADVDGVTAHNKYAFEPMTAFELLKGFLDRLIGEDVAEIGPEQFARNALNKAELLAGLTQDQGLIRTFSAQPARSQDDGFVPAFEEGRGEELNRQIPAMMADFSRKYKMVGESVVAALQAGNVQGALEAMQDGISQLNQAYIDGRGLKESEFFNVSKRWIPPYMYGYIAENYNKAVRQRLTNPSEKPVVAYIGTVVPEKWVKRTGGGTSVEVGPRPAMAPTPADLAIDEKMYQLTGRSPRGDGNGYKAFFACLTGAEENCGQLANAVKMNEFQADSLRTMAGDWIAGSRLSSQTVKVRNTFGIEPVRFRRFLANYWNNPHPNFNENMLDHPRVSIEGQANNIRILMTNEIPALNDRQAAPSEYEAGHRSTPIPCIPETDDPNFMPRRVEGTLSCRHLYSSLDTAPAFDTSDEAYAVYGSMSDYDRPLDNGDDTPVEGGGNDSAAARTIRDHGQAILGLANDRGFNLDSLTPSKCLEETFQNTLVASCLLSGDLRAPNSDTVFVLTIGAGPKFTLEPITGEDVEPRGGTAEGSIETYLVDGGGEDSALAIIEAAGYQMEDGLFSGDEDMRCLSYLPNRPLGSCHLTIAVRGVTTRIAITVSERDGGPATDVGVIRLK